MKAIEDFGGDSHNHNAPTVQRYDVAHVAAMEREKATIQSMLVIARQYPRDEDLAFIAMQKAFSRPTMAAKALYKLPRGDKTISGPSIHLAKECGRCWGNVDSGVHIIETTEDSVRIQAHAFDTEKNYRVTAQDHFARLIQRKNKNTGQTEWKEPDEIQMRELVNKRGAISLRNCLLQVVPGWFVEEAEHIAAETKKRVAKGDLEKDRDKTIRDLCAAFDKHGVNKAQLEEYLGHPLNQITEEEMSDLRGTWITFEDGTCSPSEFFVPKANAEEAAKALRTKKEKEEAPTS